MTSASAPLRTSIDDYLDSLPLNIPRIELTFVPTLTRLPSLLRFTNLKDLDISNNQLVELPELPEGLEAIWCYNNHLTHLPPFPESLRHLYAHGNHIETVTCFPRKMHIISLHHNHLQTLPTLPQELDSFHCEHNRFQRLPPLPENLRHLYCYDNPLNELPAHLPPQLKHLYCQRTNLQSIPRLPSLLIKLNISHSPVTRIENLPPLLHHQKSHSGLLHTPIYENILRSETWEEITQRLQLLSRFRRCYFLLRVQDMLRRLVRSRFAKSSFPPRKKNKTCIEDVN
jgi:Leucine-rich repeat (LRR) protein